MTSLQSLIKVDQAMSTKYEIAFSEVQEGTRILLKIKNNYINNIIEKFKILTKNRKIW